MPMGSSTSHNAKPISMVLGGIAVAIWFGFIVLFEHYSATRPRRPDISSGRIYQLDNHGSYVYLTKSEQWRLRRLEFGGLPFFITAALIERKRPREDLDKIRATYESKGKGTDEA